MELKKLYIELTSQCNLNCSICYRKAWSQELESMKPEILDQILRDLEETKTVDKVVLGGIGEPTLSPLFSKALEALQGYHLTLTTNGTTLNPKMASLIAGRADHVVISVDGTEETFQAIRQTSLTEILHGVALLQKYEQEQLDFPGKKRLSLSFQMVLSKANLQEVEAVMDLAVRAGVYTLILSHLIPASLEDADAIVYRQEGNEALKHLFGRWQNLAQKKGVTLKLPNYQLKTERYCSFVEEGASVVNAQGDVSPCYRLAHDGREVVFGREKTIEAHSYGRIGQKTLKAIWQEPAYENYRRRIYQNRYPSCCDCDLVDGCDMVRDTQSDCFSNTPSCGDCLWARNLVYCV